MFLAFLNFRGGGFLLKWKGHFSFWGSARKDIRAVWRGYGSQAKSFLPPTPSTFCLLASGPKEKASPNKLTEVKK